MEIYKGQVVSNKSLSLDARIAVMIPKLSDIPFKVFYTSPYFVKNEGGMFAIPEPGSEVLVGKDDEDFYYISTIVNKPEKFIKGNTDIHYKVIPEKYLYTNRLAPQRISFGDTKGNKIVFDNRYDGKMISSKTQLESGVGKKIILEDSPEIDSIIIRNEHDDFIKITSEANKIDPARSIQADSLGSQVYRTREGSIDVMVSDGRELNIRNESTGTKSDGVTGQYGNVNISSKNKDVSINADGYQGRIFINTADSTIQINRNGVTIFSKSDVKVNTIGSIEMKATGDISLEGRNINLNAQLGLNMQSALPASIIPPLPTTDGASTVPGVVIPTPLETPSIQQNDYRKPAL